MTAYATIRALEADVDRLLPEARAAQRPSRALGAAQRAWSAAVWEAATRAGLYPLDPVTVATGLRIAPAPVFVCGTHRSGTTLMQALLDGHPALTVLPSEGSFLTELHDKVAPLPEDTRIAFMAQEWVRRFVDPAGGRWLLGRTTETTSPYVVFARLLAAWWTVLAAPAGARGPAHPTTLQEADTTPARVPQESPVQIPSSMHPLVAVALAYGTHAGGGRLDARLGHWVDKTPTNELHLAPLFSAFPAARVLLMVRDPRHVFASHKRLEERLFGRFANERAALIHLARSHAIAAAPHPGVLTVGYEALVGDPEAVVAEVAAYLGIDFTAAMLQPTCAGRPAPANSSFADQRRRAGVILGEHRWHPLTGAELRRLSAYTGATARSLGYSLPPLAPWRRHVIKLGCTARQLARRARLLAQGGH